MAAVALLKFTQGAVFGVAGRALVVLDDGTPVQAENGGDNSSVKSWRIELLYGPPGSTFEQVPGSPTTLGQNSDSSTPYANFIPQAGIPGCYRIRLTVWTSTGYTGASDVDIRNVAVLTSGLSLVLPPYQELPKALPIQGSGDVGEKPDELNFDAQAFGWAGDYSGTRRLVNAALLRMDSLSTSGGVDWQESVLSQTTTAPPGSPTLGDRYLVPAGATGAWTGHADDIAEYNGTTWVFTAPDIGMTTYVEDVKKQYTYNGAAWVLTGSGAGLVGPTTPGQDYQVCFANAGAQDYASGVKINSGETGIEFGTASITGVSSDLVYNVASSQAHIFKINAVEVGRLASPYSNGVSLNIPEKYRFLVQLAGVTGASGNSGDIYLEIGGAGSSTGDGGSIFLLAGATYDTGGGWGGGIELKPGGAVGTGAEAGDLRLFFGAGITGATQGNIELGRPSDMPILTIVGEEPGKLEFGWSNSVPFVDPWIVQKQAPNNMAGRNFVMEAQSAGTASSGGYNGGNFIIKTGAGSGTGVAGYLGFQCASTEVLRLGNDTVISLSGVADGDTLTWKASGQAVWERHPWTDMKLPYSEQTTYGSLVYVDAAASPDDLAYAKYVWATNNVIGFWDIGGTAHGLRGQNSGVIYNVINFTYDVGLRVDIGGTYPSDVSTDITKLYLWSSSIITYTSPTQTFYSGASKRIEMNSTGIGYFGVTPAAQQADIGALTLTTGTPDNTLVDVSGTGDDSTVNSNFADVGDQINDIRTVLRTFGYMA